MKDVVMRRQTNQELRNVQKKLKFSAVYNEMFSYSVGKKDASLDLDICIFDLTKNQKKNNWILALTTNVARTNEFLEPDILASSKNTPHWQKNTEQEEQT